jgi:hypothetical protein
MQKKTRFWTQDSWVRTSVINGNQVLKINKRLKPFQIDLKWDFYKV